MQSHTELRSRWRFLPLAAGQRGNLKRDFLCLNIGSVGFKMVLLSNYSTGFPVLHDTLFKLYKKEVKKKQIVVMTSFFKHCSGFGGEFWG